MGKYSIFAHDNETIILKEDLWCYIANELAEGNRLKRLELSLKDCSAVLPENRGQLIKELEDKA